MSDDLVKQLREDQPVTQDMGSTMQCSLQDAAADRIEELEAKLAKAVELALEECPFRFGTPSYDEWRHNRRTTLAELKGQDDE